MKKFIRDWLIPICTAIIITIFIHRFLFFFAEVPSASMNPTIKPGEKLFVTRVYNPLNLERGDIVLFNSDELDKILVKRLIGLPGEKVEIKDGKVYINNNEIKEPYVSTLDGKAYFEGKTITIPEDHFLFLGDNRVESYDSRYWQEPFISKDDIIGQARCIVFPFTRVRGL